MLLLFLTLNARAQSKKPAIRHFDKEEIDNYHELKKYDYDRIIPPPKRGPITKFLGRFFEGLFKFLATGFGTFLLFLIVFGILATIVYFVIKSDSGGIIHDKETSISDMEEIEDIEQLDLPSLLRDAIAKKNYRMAIRINYLQALKELNDKKIIVWKNEKTNFDYIQEVKEYTLKNKLDHITYLYEYIWYGETFIDEALFQKLDPDFQQFNLQVQKS